MADVSAGVHSRRGRRLAIARNLVDATLDAAVATPLTGLEIEFEATDKPFVVVGRLTPSPVTATNTGIQVLLNLVGFGNVDFWAMHQPVIGGYLSPWIETPFDPSPGPKNFRLDYLALNGAMALQHFGLFADYLAAYELAG